MCLDLVLLKINKLEDRNVNITSQFVRIFKVFEDFIFVEQLKKEVYMLNKLCKSTSLPVIL